jgi:hypothetical protein
MIPAASAPLAITSREALRDDLGLAGSGRGDDLQMGTTVQHGLAGVALELRC